MSGGTLRAPPGICPVFVKGLKLRTVRDISNGVVRIDLPQYNQDIRGDIDSITSVSINLRTGYPEVTGYRTDAHTPLYLRPECRLLHYGCPEYLFYVFLSEIPDHDRLPAITCFSC